MANEWLTDVQDPPKADLMDETSISEALNPKSESEASPRTDEKLGSFPEENGHTASHEARDGAS